MRLPRKRVLAALVWLAFPVVCIIAARVFPLMDWITALQGHMADWGAAGAAGFVAVYAACNILLLPGGILGIGSGLLFGLWWGFALVLLGNVLGAAVAFLISRLALRTWVQRRIAASPRWSALDAAIDREGWKIVVLSQMHPLFPTSLLNYLYGATRLPFWKCIGWVAMGQAPGLFLYAYLGTLGQYGLNLLRGTSTPGPFEYVIWIGGLVITLILTLWFGRLALRLLRLYRAAG